MRATDIIKPYFSSLGLRLVSGEAESYEPVMVFLLHDIVYQKVCNDISKVKYQHNQKRAVNDWRKLVNEQFRRFFLHLSDEQSEIVTDLMDEFSELIANDMMILKCCVMESCSFMTLEDQVAVADLQLVSALTHIARIHWEGMIRAKDKAKSKLKYDAASSHYAELLARYYADKYKDTSLTIRDSDFEKVGDAVTAMDNKICRWVIKKTEEAINEGLHT